MSAPALRAEGRSGPALAARYLDHNVLPEGAAGALSVYRVVVENSGASSWHRDPPDGHFVGLGLFVDDSLVIVGRPLQAVVAPGERATIATTVKLPAEPGTHRLRFDMMLSGKTWFSQAGVPPLEVSLRLGVPERTPTDALLETAERRNSWFFSPGAGVYRDRAGRPRYPMFAESSKGCTITDVDGREFLDLHMGWGCCLLGYADDRIQAAIARSLRSSGNASLTHRLEIEVSEALCGGFSLGDEVLFGKNGSDVTTWAARTARVATGRKTLLFAGYHGWQDWNAARLGFAATGIPSDPGHAIGLPYGNLDALERAAEDHARDLAGIMIEPAATNVSLDDPRHERDGPYLREAQALARRHGALFMLDEIFTGFRFRGGSAQAAYGLEPDLACFGKALANGLPLSALTGRGGILRRNLGSIFYAPTHKGEMHSFAAALEALRIYREEDVPKTVWAAGESIREGVNRACRALGVDGGLFGAPYRMYFGLHGVQGEDRVLFRTLLQQELAGNGIVSHKGYVVPSLSHDRRAVDRCVAGFAAALATTRRALGSGSAIHALDIPDVQEEGPSS